MKKTETNEKERGMMKNLLIRVWEILRGMGPDRPLSVEDIRALLIEEDRAAGICEGDANKDKYNPRLLRANIKAINAALESPRANFAVTKQNDPDRVACLKSKASEKCAAARQSTTDKIEKLYVGRREDKECLYYNKDALSYEELRFLFDAVQSASFIPKDTADSICQKLTALCGEVDKQLWRERILRQDTPLSDKVFESIRKIEQAIAQKKRLRFMYYKEHNDLMCDAESMDPIAVLCDKGYYYLYGYSYISNGRCALRVDRMKNIKVADEDSTCAAERESFLAADGNVKTQMLLRK